MSGLLKLIYGNIAILVLAFLYWFAVDYLYAINFELYHPFEWLVQLSFLVFALISFEYSHKVLRETSRKKRLAYAFIPPGILVAVFHLILYYYGIDFHVWVGYFLLPA